MQRRDHDLVAEHYIPSPNERVRNQLALYEATAGGEGETLQRPPVVILTMTGATSGKIRKAPRRIERDGTYLAVASAAGAPTHPAWYQQHDRPPRGMPPRRDPGALVARPPSVGREKSEAWKLAESRWPHFSEYRAKPGREIPILLIEPATPRPDRDCRYRRSDTAPRSRLIGAHPGAPARLIRTHQCGEQRT
jgi:deazaflavin-dependent oxidoreductase (nitroreductase family)